jgi:hypothetical protein
MRLVFACALLAGLLFAAPAAQSQSSTALFLYVNFFANGDIAVTLPDGTPVGVTSGSPTVIPAGFYTVQMTGPGGCTNLPYFNLKGPGNNIIDSMDQGEEANKNVNANFLPNSTYTWWNAQNPSQVFTFVTNGQVLGTAPTAPDSGKHGTATTTDLLGSARATIRGTLTGAVSAAGKLSVAFKGKSVGSLQSGKYKFVISDKSSNTGFLVQKGSHTPTPVSGIKFVGKRTKWVVLTAGKWSFLPLAGKPAFTVTVKGATS